MGRRGPAPMPTKLKLLHGERRPSRLNRTEPQPAPLMPEAPEDIDARARAIWDRVMVDFGAAEVIRRADQDALRCYCEAVSRYEEAARLLKRSGPLVRGTRRSELVRNPLHQIVRDNANLVRIYARELGLTPAARVGLHTDESQKPTSSLERLRERRVAAR